MISPLIFINFNKKDRKEKKLAKEKTRVLNEKKKELAKEKSVATILKDEVKIENNKNNLKNNMQITTEQIKKLRDQTSISIMQCKKALEEADGDFEKAIVILRKKSGEISAKKVDRSFKSGTIQAYMHSNGTIGTMVELNCESDFVANNDEFKALARDIAMHITATNPKFIKKENITEEDKKVVKEVFENEVKGKPEEVRTKILDGKLSAYFAEMVLMDQPFIKNPDVTIQELVDVAVQKFGEKMAVTRFQRFKVLE